MNRKGSFSSLIALLAAVLPSNDDDDDDDEEEEEEEMMMLFASSPRLSFSSLHNMGSMDIFSNSSAIEGCITIE
jgi:hypothetical protein